VSWVRRSDTAGKAHTDRSGVAGRVLGPWNSWCVTCGHWEFGSHLADCPRCGSAIAWHLTTPELRFLRSGTSLGRM
jgi:hypothetical protein